MIYSISFHRSIWKDDFQSLSKNEQQKVFRILIKKLSTNPLEFGKPLSGNLKGLYSLRIGEYRAVYSIHKEKIEVFVVKIGFRRNMEVYLQTAKRLELL